MSLITLVVVLIVVGVLLWLVNTYIPLQPPFHTIINIVVILFVIIWLLNVLGLFSGVGDIRVGGRR